MKRIHRSAPIMRLYTVRYVHIHAHHESMRRPLPFVLCIGSIRSKGTRLLWLHLSVLVVPWTAMDIIHIAYMMNHMMMVFACLRSRHTYICLLRRHTSSCIRVGYCIRKSVIHTELRVMNNHLILFVISAPKYCAQNDSTAFTTKENS